MDTFRNPETMKMRVSGFSQSEIEKLLVQMKQNNSTELLGHSIKIYNKNEPPAQTELLGHSIKIYNKNEPPDPPPRPQIKKQSFFPSRAPIEPLYLVLDP